MDSEWEDITPQSNQATQTSQDEWEDITPAKESQPNLGQRTFDIPSAAIRGGIRAVLQGKNPVQGYQEGATNFKSNPTFQQENLQNINQVIPSSKEAYTGDFASKGRLAGDIFNRFQIGLPASVAGVAEDTATNPAQLLAGMSIEGLAKALSPVAYKGLTLGERASKLPIESMLSSESGQSANIANQTAKRIKNAEALLKPNDNFSEQINRGGTSNMAEQASKYISPAKNYTEVNDQMNLAQGFPMEERSKIYNSTDVSADRSHLDKINELISNESTPETNPQSGSATSNNRLKQYRDVQTTEVNNLNQIPNDKLQDPEFWQERKAYYQDQANKAGAYGASEKMTARAEAYKALAQGAQDKTYSLNEHVLPLNLENAGLQDAATRSSELAAAQRGQAPKSLPQDIVENIRPTKMSWLDSVIRKLTRTTPEGYFGEVPSTTRNISKASKSIDKSQGILDTIKSIIEGRSDKGNLEYPLQLPAPSPRGLPSPDDMRTSDIRGGRFLPQGQGSGPTINAEGSSTINQPEILESDKSRMAKQFGMPNYGGQKEFVIPQGRLDNSKKVSSIVRKILKKREQNFG